MNKKPIILVTGATGAVGPRVVTALCDAGYSVRTLSIDSPPAGAWSGDVEICIGDVTDASTVQTVMQGVDAVIHLAALLHIVDPPPALQKEYERINVGGTATVVAAATQAGVRRIVFFSTIAVYGPSNGHVLSEASPTNPNTFYAQTKLSAEWIVLNARGADGQLLGTVLRLGAVYGARIKGNYERLLCALVRNHFIPVGDGLNRRSLVYDKDVGRAAVLAVSRPTAAGRVFNVTDGKYHTLNEIIGSICSALGRKKPRFSIPIATARILIGFIEKGCHIFDLTPPVTQETLDKYTEDIAVDGGLFQRELDFMPKYDLLTGWEDVIREMKR